MPPLSVQKGADDGGCFLLSRNYLFLKVNFSCLIKETNVWHYNDKLALFL